MNVRIRGWLVVALLLVASGCDGFEKIDEPTSVSARNVHFLSQTETPVYAYHVVNEYPHDRRAFTQGLVVDGEELVEGTGRRGQSTLRRVDLETGTVLQSVDLDNALFGEGVTIFGERIFQLTWQAEQGFIYDRTSFAVLDTFAYAHQGWGITHDGAQLIVSDGTDTIRFWDPETLQETRAIKVRDGGFIISRLNEMEYIHGEIWANVWKTDLIARIDPATGNVTGWVDLRFLLPLVERTNTTDVLNGIAYDAANDRLFVTGKNWPKLYEIDVNDPPLQRDTEEYEPA